MDKISKLTLIVSEIACLVLIVGIQFHFIPEYLRLNNNSSDFLAAMTVALSCGLIILHEAQRSIKWKQ